MMSTGMSTPRWSALTEPEEIAEGLGDLYRRRGSERYDEAVTQTEHALQCAALAMSAGADAATIAAALLHDVGHLLIPDGPAGEGDRRHEMVASRFLRRWFGPDVVQPIELHVAAKRYLCAVEPGYFSTLSPASVHSLELQGGPMSEAERSAFEGHEYHAVALDLRRWDDLAKVPEAPTPSMGELEQIVEDVLGQRRHGQC